MTGALDALLALVVLIDEDMKTSLAREDLTVPRAHLLWHVHHHGPTTQRALADALRVTPRNITGLVDGLVASGHARRGPHPDDRRATLVSLTRRGATTMAAMDRAHQELARTLFADLPEGQFRAFVAGLAHVTDRVQAALAEAGG